MRERSRHPAGLIWLASLLGLAGACGGGAPTGTSQAALSTTVGLPFPIQEPLCVVCTSTPLTANGGGPTQCTSLPAGNACASQTLLANIRSVQPASAGGYIDVSWDNDDWNEVPLTILVACPDAALTATLSDSAGNVISSQTMTQPVCMGFPPKIHFIDEMGNGGDFSVSASATIGGSPYSAILTVARPAMTVYGATIQTYYNTFVTADNDGGSSVSTNLTNQFSQAEWIIQDLNGGYLQSGDLVRIAHNSGVDGSFWYGSAENGGGPGSVFHINRTAAGGWETFTISGTSATETPGTLAALGADSTSTSTTFQSINGYYMSANDGGGLTGDGSIAVDRTVAGGWEWFTVKFTEPCTRGDDGFPLAPYCASNQACNSTSGCYVACTANSCASGLRCVPSIGCVPPACTAGSCSQFESCDPNSGCYPDPSKFSSFTCHPGSIANSANCNYTFVGTETQGIVRVTGTPTVASLLDMVKQGYPDGLWSPRNRAIGLALKQVPSTTPANTAAGLCGDDAIEEYSPNQGPFKDTEWCSEFVRDMVLRSSAISDKGRCDLTSCDIDPLGLGCVFPFCVHTAHVSDITTVGLWKAMFQAYGGWHSPFTPQLVQPGDYISMVNAEGQPDGHSEIVVAISVDNSTIWTMSGNWASGGSPHCEAFAQQAFVTSGGPTGSTVESHLNSVGDLSVLY